MPRICPPVRTYSQTAENAAARELDYLGAGAVLAEFMADYADLRRMARDCWTK